MKSAIAYYSYSGNTKKVALFLRDYLEKDGAVRLIELNALDEPSSFFRQAQRAFFRQEAKIEAVGFDLSGFDLICFGTPVWAFGPTPAMNTYLKRCFGLENKSVILFTTYGSGTGNRRCLRIMRNIVKSKDAKPIRSFSISQARIKDSDFVLRAFNSVL
jgi:flavodoxin